MPNAPTQLRQLPIWNDNYIYLLRRGSRALVVDPAQAEPVLSWLERHPEVKLEAVLNTHHHPDHTGGNQALHDATGCEVIGPAHDQERFPALTRGAAVGERLEVAGFELDVLDVRAHTRSHIAYALLAPVHEVIRHGHHGAPTVAPALADRPVLFVGDALFAAGCGRLFEGDGEQLHAALSTLAAQDPRSLVACAHEYTEGNLRFAAATLPSIPAIAARLRDLDTERAGSGSTVPSTLAAELESNPFLLALDPINAQRILSQLGADGGTPVDAVTALRRAKDHA